MTIPGLDNLDAIAWRAATAGEYVVFYGNLFIKGPTPTPGLIVAPVAGFRFEYDINSDRLRLIPAPTEEVIPLAAPAAPLTSLSFQQAFEALQRDKTLRIARASWKGHWLEWDLAHHPTLADVTGTSRVSWSHRKDDLIARDWGVVSPVSIVK